MLLCFLCRQAKQAFAIDFENLPELPTDAFELAPHKEISLKSMPAVNTLLPPDHHYKVAHCTVVFHDLLLIAMIFIAAIQCTAVKAFRLCFVYSDGSWSLLVAGRSS